MRCPKCSGRTEERPLFTGTYQHCSKCDEAPEIAVTTKWTQASTAEVACLMVDPPAESNGWVLVDGVPGLYQEWRNGDKILRYRRIGDGWFKKWSYDEASV